VDGCPCESLSYVHFRMSPLLRCMSTSLSFMSTPMTAKSLWTFAMRIRGLRAGQGRRRIPSKGLQLRVMHVIYIYIKLYIYICRERERLYGMIHMCFRSLPFYRSRGEVPELLDPEFCVAGTLAWVGRAQVSLLNSNWIQLRLVVRARKSYETQ
jgi:hypothetical protein